MSKIDELIQLAENEVGYLEKSKAAFTSDPLVIYDKTKGAGSDNITKYEADLVKCVGYPYAQGVAWCDMFVDWLFISIFGKDKAKEIIGGWSAYTPTSAQFYKNMGRWSETPIRGAQIFFRNNTRICHTGIVYKVDALRVYTIEGNTSSTAGVVPNGGCVAKKSYPIRYERIAGYGLPRYPVESTESPQNKNIITKVQTSGSKLNVRNKPNNGQIVGRLDNGSPVTILDIEYGSGWYKIGDNKFVSPVYVKSDTVGKITTGALNIRDSDSVAGKGIGTYKKNEKVILLNQSSTGWYLTPKGWISNKYVEII